MITSSVRDAAVGTILRSSEGQFFIMQGGMECILAIDRGLVSPRRISPLSYKEQMEVCTPELQVEVDRTYDVKCLWSARHAGGIVDWLILSNADDPYIDFPHRFKVDDFGVRIPVLFPSSDPRIRNGTTTWTVRSGQFWTTLKKMQTCKFFFDENRKICAYFRGMSGAMNVPKQ